MEVLIRENGYVEYLIQFEEGDFELSASFKVFEATSWDADNNEVSKTDHYLSGSIKWDGCSNFYFPDNGLHLCGKRYFEKHKKVMDAIFDACSKKIKCWDNYLACE